VWFFLKEGFQDLSVEWILKQYTYIT